MNDPKRIKTQRFSPFEPSEIEYETVPDWDQEAEDEKTEREEEDQ